MIIIINGHCYTVKALCYDFMSYDLIIMDFLPSYVLQV